MNFKMKTFKMKTLAVAAIAALTISGAANARIADAAATGGSEFVFSAWDSSVGYTLDLGWTAALNSMIGVDTSYATPVNGTVVASMVPGNGIIFDQVLTGFSSFANLSTVQWNLVAADSVGRNRLLVTQGDTAANMITSNANVKNAVTAFSTNYVANVNNKGTHVGADFNVDGYANTTALADGIAFAGAASFGNTINNRVNDTSSLLGASANLWVLGMNSSTTTGAAGTAPGYLAQLKTASGLNVIARTYLSGVDNQYHLEIAAPIPEADISAMLLAGLGLMGFIARRRTQQG